MCFYIAANMTTWWKYTGIIFIFFSSCKGIFLPYFPSLSHSYWPYNTPCKHTSPCWVCHVTWRNTSSLFFFFLSAKQPVAWIAEMLDLIRAAPIWISKETDVPTAAEFVTHPHLIEPSRCPWRRVYTEPHMNTHTRGKNWGGGDKVWQLCNQVIPLLQILIGSRHAEKESVKVGWPQPCVQRQLLGWAGGRRVQNEHIAK